MPFTAIGIKSLLPFTAIGIFIGNCSNFYVILKAASFQRGVARQKEAAEMLFFWGLGCAIRRGATGPKKSNLRRRGGARCHTVAEFALPPPSAEMATHCANGAISAFTPPLPSGNLLNISEVAHLTHLTQITPTHPPLTCYLTSITKRCSIKPHIPVFRFSPDHPSQTACANKHGVTAQAVFLPARARPSYRLALTSLKSERHAKQAQVHVYVYDYVYEPLQVKEFLEN